MLQTKKRISQLSGARSEIFLKGKKHLRGMTLIEVTVGMVVIIIVTLIAYMGVSAGANFTARGTDLRNADGAAVNVLENEISAEDPAVTEINIPFQVNKIVYSSSDSDAVVTEVETIVPSGNLPAGLVEAEYAENDVVVKYDMYLPEKTLPDENTDTNTEDNNTENNTGNINAEDNNTPDGDEPGDNP